MTNPCDTPQPPTHTAATLSLYAAEALTGRSRRTLWRWIASGSLPRTPDDAHGRATVLLEAVGPLSRLPILGNEDLLRSADSGNATAQTELALLCLEHGVDSGAVYWLKQAIQQNQPEALHLLFMCHLRGKGCEENPRLAMAYLAKAALAGHVIAQHQLDAWMSLQPHPNDNSQSAL